MRPHLYSGGTNDCIWYLNSTEACQLTLSGSDVRWTATGGTGTFKFNQQTDLAGGMKLSGTAITASAAALNYVDLTSSGQTQLDAKAPLASPALTGIPTAPTAANGTDTTQVATTAFVEAESAVLQTAIDAVQTDVDGNESDSDTALALKANLASPHFTGNVGIGTSSPDGDTVFTVNGEGKYGTNGVISIEDSTSMEAGNGGGIALKGIRDVAGNQTVYGGIRALKDNGTGGHFGASIELVSRANGSGDPEVGFTVNSDQTCTAASNLTVTDNVEATEYHSIGSGHLKFKGGGNDIIFYPADTETLQITRSSADCRFTSRANGGSGTFRFNQQTAFNDTVVVKNVSGDPSAIADSSILYAKDDSGSSEMFCLDEAGNSTKISPHNSESGDWEFLSHNIKTGETVRVNMMDLIKTVESLSGKQLIFDE